MNPKLFKIVLLVGSLLVMIATVTIAVVTDKPYNGSNDDIIDVEVFDDLQYSISTVILPPFVSKIGHPILTPTNHLLFTYVNSTTNEDGLGLCDLNGTNFRIIYNETIKTLPGSNGLRLMPFADNRRVATGDYVIETYPNLDECDPSLTRLVPINYPPELLEDDKVLFRWSEIIIAPDNIHYAWTTLHASLGAVNFIGRLENQTGNYSIEKAQIISDYRFVNEDSSHPGYLKVVDYFHGGEIKQFSHGGAKITLAGAGKQGLAKSVIQDLLTNESHPLVQEPGYEETTIISPDGQLGLTMSTRFSPSTNCAILGLLPRPLSILTLMGMSQVAYTYSVTDVRTTRIGNVGPALIDIKKSVANRTYHGHDLHDPSDNQQWVFSSPMSWDTTSTIGIWPEKNRKDRNEVRIRKVMIHTSENSTYKPGKPIPIQDTPDTVPFGRPLSELKNVVLRNIAGKIEGVKGNREESYMDYEYASTYINTTYHDFSEDGKVFANGYEIYTVDRSKGETTYTGNVSLSGEDKGKMDFKLVFAGNPLKLMKNQSYGYSMYHGQTIHVEDMAE